MNKNLMNLDELSEAIAFEENHLQCGVVELVFAQTNKPNSERLMNWESFFTSLSKFSNSIINSLIQIDKKKYFRKS